MPILRRIFFLGLALALLPAAAWGAGRFSLLPGLVLYGEWTDNVLLTPEDSEEEKIADYSMTAVPGLRLRYDSYRTEAYLSFAAGFRHYFTHDELDGWPEYYQGGLGWAYWINPVVRISLFDELTYFTDPRDQPFAEGGDVESLRSEAIVNNIGTLVTYNMSRLATLEGGYTFSSSEFKEEDLADTIQHLVTLTWTYQLSQTYRLIAFYNYTRALFDPHYDLLRSTWDNEYYIEPSFFPTTLDEVEDFDTHIPGVGLFYQATPSLSFEVRSGVVMPAIMRNGIYQLDDLDWYQRVEVTKLFWRMLAAANYTRTVAPAHGLAGAVLTQTVGGRLEEHWLRQFETVQEAAYTNYEQEAADIDAVSAGAGANYYFFNWLGVGAVYSYLQQVGHMDDGDQRLYAHRVTLLVALTSPRPDWLRF